MQRIIQIYDFAKTVLLVSTSVSLIVQYLFENNELHFVAWYFDGVIRRLIPRAMYQLFL